MKSMLVYREKTNFNTTYFHPLDVSVLLTVVILFVISRTYWYHRQSLKYYICLGITPEYPTHPTVFGLGLRLGLGLGIGLGLGLGIRVRD